MKQRRRREWTWSKVFTTAVVTIIIQPTFLDVCILTTNTKTTTFFVTAVPIRPHRETKEKEQQKRGYPSSGSDISGRLHEASSKISQREDDKRDNFNAPFVRNRKTYAASAAEAIRDAARSAWDDAVRTASLVTQPPRDIVDGVWRGVANLYRGYAAAATTIAGLPWDAWELLRNTQIGGGSNGGNNGLAELAMGTAYSAATSTLRAAATLVGGVATCLYQMATGIYATPFAVRATVLGMVWDEDRSDWTYYSLDGEAVAIRNEVVAEEVMNKQKSGTLSSGTTTNPRHLRRRRNVRDRSYYKLLNVHVDASSEEIRSAYRREALLSHPDKNPPTDSEAAAERFLSLHSAYRTLSDDESRDAYDEHGICYRETEAIKSSSDVPEVDPYIFFAVLFGSESVQPYVGELRIASVIDNLSNLGSRDEDDDLGESKSKASSLRQKRRAVHIALHLRDRVSSYLPGGITEEKFRLSCRTEAERIAKGDFGDIYLTAIGSGLLLESDQFLGLRTSVLGVKGRAAQAKGFAVSLWRKLATRTALVKTASISIGAVIKTTLEKGTKDSETNASSEKDCGDIYQSKMKRNARVLDKLEQVSLSNALQLAWKYNIEDIQETLKLACGKLFADGERLPYEGERRAEAVRILGEEFFVVGKTASVAKEAAKDATTEIYAHDVEAAFVASLVMNNDDGASEMGAKQKARRRSS